MFSATMVLLSGNILSGVILILIIAYFAASYMLLSRNGDRYPTNLCVMGCILFAIVTDILWGFFNFGTTPLFAVSGDPGTATQLYYEAMIAGGVCYSGLIMTNIALTSRFKKTKIALFALLLANASLLLAEFIKIGSVSLRFSVPGIGFLGTVILLICTACVLIIALGVLAVMSREKRSTINNVAAVILALLAVAAAAVGIIKTVSDHNAGFIMDRKTESSVFVPHEYDDS